MVPMKTMMSTSKKNSLTTMTKQRRRRRSQKAITKKTNLSQTEMAKRVVIKIVNCQSKPRSYKDKYRGRIMRKTILVGPRKTKKWHQMTTIVMMMKMAACVHRYSTLQTMSHISRGQQVRRGLTSNISRIGAARDTMATEERVKGANTD